MTSFLDYYSLILRPLRHDPLRVALDLGSHLLSILVKCPLHWLTFVTFDIMAKIKECIYAKSCKLQLVTRIQPNRTKR